MRSYTSLDRLLELLDEFSKKLLSNTRGWIRVNRRIFVLRVVAGAAFPVAVLAIAGMESIRTSGEFIFVDIIETVVRRLRFMDFVNCLAVAAPIIVGSLALVSRNRKTLYFRARESALLRIQVERLIRLASEINDKGEMDTVRRAELQIRLGEAELRYIENERITDVPANEFRQLSSRSPTDRWNEISDLYEKVRTETSKEQRTQESSKKK
jgi:hypothetical protein